MTYRAPISSPFYFPQFAILYSSPPLGIGEMPTLAELPRASALPMSVLLRPERIDYGISPTLTQDHCTVPKAPVYLAFYPRLPYFLNAFYLSFPAPSAIRTGSAAAQISTNIQNTPAGNPNFCSMLWMIGAVA